MHLVGRFRTICATTFSKLSKIKLSDIMYLELKYFSNFEKSFYSLIFSILSTLFGNLSEKIIPNHKYGDIKSLGRDSDVRTSFKRHLFAGCEVCRNIKWKESISLYLSQGKHLRLCCLSHDKQLS